jgi:hypothetical protein
MNTHAGRRRSFLLVALLLLISILLEQYWIVGLAPWISGLGGIRPMVVFLDIPVAFPVTIDLIPVGILFFFFYSIVILPGLPRTGGSVWPALRKRMGAVVAGLSALLVCLLAGGGIFYLLQDHLSREVRNGIDSFGIQADIYLPYPGEGTIHLRGSMILLVACYIGLRISMRTMRDRPAMMEVVRAEAPMPEERVIGVGEKGRGVRKKISMQIPEPVLVEKWPEPVLMEKRPEPVLMEKRPEAGIGRGQVYPCVVDMEMAPRAGGK